MNQKYVVSWLVLAFLCVSCLKANGQVDQPTEQKKETGSSDKLPTHADDFSSRERVISVLHRQAFNKDSLVQQQAFRMMANNPEIHQALGDGVQLELVKTGLAKNNGLVGHAFKILEDSSIPGPERQDLLMGAFDSDASELREPAFRFLSQDREKVIPRILAAINRDPGGDHRVAIRLFERWGPSASDATPVLIKRYEALKAKAEKNKTSADYLDIVYALAEIGPSAKAGLSIALDAAEENGKGDREVYPMVGLACVERMLGGEFLKPSFPTETEKKYQKYAKSLMDNYDKDKDLRLSKLEFSAMRRPPAGADANLDGFVTTKELTRNLAGGNRVESKSNTTQGSLRKEIERQRSYHGRG